MGIHIVSKKENLREHMGQRQAAQQKHKVALGNWKHPQHPRQESKRVNYGTSTTQGLFYSQWKEFSKSMYSDTERFPRWRKMQTAWSSLCCKINLSLKPSRLTVRKWEPEECQVNLLVFKSSPCQCHPRRPDRVGSLSMSEQAARGGERGCCQCLVSDVVKWEYILIALADRLVMHAWIPDSKTTDKGPFPRARNPATLKFPLSISLTLTGYIGARRALVWDTYWWPSGFLFGRDTHENSGAARLDATFAK